jgi:predicted transcriptional regulator
MITQRMKDIIIYIYENGVEEVVATPRLVKQSDELYQRVWKLEDKGILTVKRNKGMESTYSLTDFGIKLVENNFTDIQIFDTFTSHN